MPRDGSGVASAPPGSSASPNTLIESAKYNALIADIYNLLNTEWPVALLPVVSIAKGGTGAATAIAGFDNLSNQTAVVSASTTDLSAVSGQYVTITGTTTINSFGTAKAGVIRTLKFNGILTLTYNATSMILPGFANIVTAGGDTATFASEGSGNWRCLSYERAAVRPVIVTPWTPYTPTFTNLGTVTNIAAFSRREGDTQQIRVTFTTGTPSGGGEPRVSTDGVTIDTTKMPASGFQYVGDVGQGAVSSATITVLVPAAAVGYVNFGLQNAASSGLTKITAANAVFANNTTYSFVAEYPAQGW